MDEDALLRRITVNPKIFGGKPTIRGRRLAVEHVLGMLTAGDTVESILTNYPWLERKVYGTLLHEDEGYERIKKVRPLHSMSGGRPTGKAALPERE